MRIPDGIATQECSGSTITVGFWNSHVPTLPTSTSTRRRGRGSISRSSDPEPCHRIDHHKMPEAACDPSSLRFRRQSLRRATFGPLRRAVCRIQSLGLPAPTRLTDIAGPVATSVFPARRRRRRAASLLRLLLLRLGFSARGPVLAHPLSDGPAPLLAHGALAPADRLGDLWRWSCLRRGEDLVGRRVDAHVDVFRCPGPHSVATGVHPRARGREGSRSPRARRPLAPWMWGLLSSRRYRRA